MDADTPGAAAAIATPDMATQVAQVVSPYLTEGAFPGVSVAVVTDGHLTVAQGYGLGNVASGSPVAADTRFDIGSVTKTFTAIGVLMLYQDSQGTARPLDLDAPIGQYLHNTRMFQLPRKWSRITTRELLDMTSGIENVPDAGNWRAELKSAANHRLLFAPGTRTYYSNADYYLLGELIEQWTGQSYATFVQDRIIGPLGLSATQELGRAPKVPGQAVGYGAPQNRSWPRAALLNGNQMYAASGMVSTARDMGTFMTALLGGQLLSPATYGQLWSTTGVPPYGLSGPSFARGPGWDTVILAGDGPVQVTKSGQVPGFTTQVILDPSTGTGVFVSFNTDYHGGWHPSGSTAYQVAASIFEAAEAASTAGG